MDKQIFFPPPTECFPFPIGQKIYWHYPGPYPEEGIVSDLIIRDFHITIGTKYEHRNDGCNFELNNYALATSRENNNRALDWLWRFGECRWGGFRFAYTTDFNPENVLKCIKERPGIPIFSEPQSVAIAKWYFGLIPCAPVLEGNAAYDKYGVGRLDGKAFWLKDLKTNIAFPAMYIRRFDVATHISLYEPFDWDRAWYGKEWIAYGQRPDNCPTWDEEGFCQGLESKK